ncbi:MAG: quinone-dependent dihydroorotate dehydrogenase [Armatimonadetes bacterium]|nr:quinone-dependent dihydroorotate dehydrogenase [Armatimonadota bacterium]
MDLYGSLLKPLAFRCDPEFAHEAGLALIASGAFRSRKHEDPRLAQTLFGVHFSNPIGLAAGFDKNAVAADRWEDFGFGFAELGTVTYLQQPGNPGPRLFRIPEEEALINRMGFNNQGAQAMAQRLSASQPAIPIGINLGKSKITELKDAPRDYQRSFKRLHTLGDYFVVNVSSPNTPGLRALQEKGPLLDILSSMKEVDATRPLFVKVAPDLEHSALDQVIEVAHEANLTGLIATNTTLRRDVLRRDPQLEGGLSGKPITRLANDFMRHLFSSCEREMILIGVGGIGSGKDAYERVCSGAHLCQVYTGWVYGGPDTAVRILRELSGILDREGIEDLASIRGSAPS